MLVEIKTKTNLSLKIFQKISTEILIFNSGCINQK
jgi:hypothetical protein